MATVSLVPDHLELLYSHVQIASRIQELATEIDLWATEAQTQTGQDLLVVCILRGGAFFFSELALAVTPSIEPAFCRASSYAKGRNDAPQRDLSFNFGDLAVAGRNVVLVDAICDSGRTFAAMAARATGGRARSVRTVACVHRVRADSVHTPTLSAFIYDGPEWLAGYGMRDQNQGMNWPAIYRVKKSGEV